MSLGDRVKLTPVRARAGARRRSATERVRLIKCTTNGRPDKYMDAGDAFANGL